MVRHKSQETIYRERLHNLAKARAVKKMLHSGMVGGTHYRSRVSKPFTNAERVADLLGVSGAISNGLDKLGPVGSALRGVHNFAKNVLGYGRRRRVRRRRHSQEVSGLGRDMDHRVRHRIVHRWCRRVY